MGSVLESSICHYCGPDGEKATTQDHIVPRCLLPKPLSMVPYWFRQHFVVPSCSPCNRVKAHYRSTCMCPQCTWCWGVASKVYLPLGFSVRIVDVAMLSKAARMKADHDRFLRRLEHARRLSIIEDSC